MTLTDVTSIQCVTNGQACVGKMGKKMKGELHNGSNNTNYILLRDTQFLGYYLIENTSRKK